MGKSWMRADPGVPPRRMVHGSVIDYRVVSQELLGTLGHAGELGYSLRERRRRDRPAECRDLRTKSYSDLTEHRSRRDVPAITSPVSHATPSTVSASR